MTGATGNTGSGVVAGLLARGTRVRALVRSEAKGEGLKSQGAEVALGDLEDSATLSEGLFEGVTAVYFCTWNGPTALDQWKKLHAALGASGASPRIVHGSAFGTPQSRIIKQLAAADENLKSSGLVWTILRPTFFMQNTMMTAQTVKEQSTIYFERARGRRASLTCATSSIRRSVP